MSTGNGTGFTVYGLGRNSTLANGRRCSFSTFKMEDWFVSDFNLKLKLQGDYIFEILFFALLIHPLQWYLKALLLLYFFSLSIEAVSVQQSFLLNVYPGNIVFQMESKRFCMHRDLYPVLSSLLGRTGQESFC